MVGSKKANADIYNVQDQNMSCLSQKLVNYYYLALERIESNNLGILILEPNADPPVRLLLASSLARTTFVA